MKNILKYTVIALSAAVMTTSCKDFLEQPPILSQSNELTLSSFNGISLATAGMYAPLASTSWYSADRIIVPEMRSGNGAKSRGDGYDSNRYFTDYEWNYSVDNTPALWGLAYYVISAANNIIDAVDNNAETILASDNTATEQDLNNFKAEALFLRAFSHFELALYYAQAYNKGRDNLGVPVILVPDPELDDKPARETVGKVYDQVIADLLEAEKIIDPEYVPNRGTDKDAWANIHVIQAMLSRVYLYMSDWSNAEAYATKVIDSKVYTMWEADDFNAATFAAQAGTGGETIFEMFGDTGNNYWGSWNDISNIASMDGSYADAQISPDLYDLYETDDVRFSNLRFTDGDKNCWTFKYEGKLDVAQDCNNVPIIRLSEMYLNRAEARMAKGDAAGALQDINVIREKRNASARTSGGMDIVRLERRLELAYEGHYLFDLARWNEPVERTYFVSAQIKDIPADSFRWALPIARRELEVNPNLEQNPGY